MAIGRNISLSSLDKVSRWGFVDRAAEAALSARYFAAMGIKALEHNAAWRLEHVLECAKAVIDSLIGGIEYPDSPADQRATE